MYSAMLIELPLIKTIVLIHFFLNHLLEEENVNDFLALSNSKVILLHNNSVQLSRSNYMCIFNLAVEDSLRAIAH